MAQKIHPRGVIWVPSSSPPVVILGPSKQPNATSIYEEVRALLTYEFFVSLVNGKISEGSGHCTNNFVNLHTE